MSNLGKRAREEEEFPAWEAQQAMSVAGAQDADFSLLRQQRIRVHEHEWLA